MLKYLFKKTTIKTVSKYDSRKCYMIEHLLLALEEAIATYYPKLNTTQLVVIQATEHLSALLETFDAESTTDSDIYCIKNLMKTFASQNYVPAITTTVLQIVDDLENFKID